MFCDTEIISSDNHVFKLHRAILATRSPVFASAIDHILRDTKIGAALDSKTLMAAESKRSDEKDGKDEKSEKVVRRLPIPFTAGSRSSDGQMLKLHVSYDKNVMEVIMRYAYTSVHCWSTDMKLNYNIIAAAIKFRLNPLVWEERAHYSSARFRQMSSPEIYFSLSI